MKTALIPGSFDPVTKGHLNLISRCAAVFDAVIVCVMVNSAKAPMFTECERTDFLRRTTKHLPNVTVFSSNGLLVDFAKEHGVSVVIKGVRDLFDFEQESTMAQINRTLSPELETLFLPAEPSCCCISSSAAKELYRSGASLGDFLPEEIIPEFTARMNEHI